VKEAVTLSRIKDFVFNFKAIDLQEKQGQGLGPRPKKLRAKPVTSKTATTATVTSITGFGNAESHNV